MKRFTSLLIGCSMALAGAVLAQQPEEQQTPKNKRGEEKTHAAEAKPGTNTAKPEEKPAKQRGATNEPGAGKGRRARANQESATAPGTETGVSSQPVGKATNEAGAGKGRKARANQE